MFPCTFAMKITDRIESVLWSNYNLWHPFLNKMNISFSRINCYRAIRGRCIASALLIGKPNKQDEILLTQDRYFAPRQRPESPARVNTGCILVRWHCRPPCQIWINNYCKCTVLTTNLNFLGITRFVGWKNSRERPNVFIVFQLSLQNVNKVGVKETTLAPWRMAIRRVHL